jgi:hypothetical protein
MTYTKEAYDIDLNELIPKLDKIINSQTLSSNLQITKEEYLARIKFGGDYLKKLLGYKNEPYFIVNASQPSYDYWLGIYLSTQKPHLIPLILDYHFEKNDDPSDFVNHLQHLVLIVIDKNIFHDVESQLKEISIWVREKRNIFERQNNIIIQIININVVELNLYQTFNNAWSDDPNITKNQSNDEDPFKDGLIKSPCGNLLFEALSIHCENSSRSNLKKLLMGEKIDSKIILNSNFLKLSLYRPIKALVSECYIPFNNVEASVWISENFVKRDKNGTNRFSAGSAQKLMSKKQTEPENAQIKYEHWFNKNHN